MAFAVKFMEQVWGIVGLKIDASGVPGGEELDV